MVVARRDGGRQGEMAVGKERQQQQGEMAAGQGEMAAGKERRQQARRDGGRQGETAAGKERRWGGKERWRVFLRMTTKPSEWVKKMASAILSSTCCNMWHVPESLDDSALLFVRILEELL